MIIQPLRLTVMVRRIPPSPEMKMELMGAGSELGWLMVVMVVVEELVTWVELLDEEFLELELELIFSMINTVGAWLMHMPLRSILPSAHPAHAPL